MKRATKIILGIIGGLLALMLIFIAFVVFFIDPNDYKPQLIEAVKQETGRTLEIKGDIKLAFFPGIYFELGEISLSNAQHFSKPIFISVKNAISHVKLRPLLQKRIEIDSLQLQGVTLVLERDAHGHTNWEELLNRQASKTSSNSNPILNVKQLELSDATVIWDDKKDNNLLVLLGLNLETDELALEKPIQLTLSSDIQSYGYGKIELRGHIDSSAQITIKSAEKIYQLTHWKTIAKISEDKFGEHPLTFTTTFDINLDLAQQVLLFNINEFSFPDLKSRLIGYVQGTKILTEPVLLGQLEVIELTPKLVLERFRLPAMSYIDLLKTVAFKTFFSANKNNINLEDLQLTVAENTLKTKKLQINLADQTLTSDVLTVQMPGVEITGQMTASDFTKPVINGNLELIADLPKIAYYLKQAGVHLPMARLPTGDTLKQANLTTAFQLNDAGQFFLKNIRVTSGHNSLKSKEILLDLNKQFVKLDDFSLQTMGSIATGNLDITNLLTQPLPSGRVQLAIADFPNLLHKLGYSLDGVPAAMIPSNLNVVTELQSTDNSLNLNNLSVESKPLQLKIPQLTVHPVEQKLTFSDFSFNVLGIASHGNLQASAIFQNDRHINGFIQLANFNPRVLLEQLNAGHLLPNTADTNTFATLALDTQLAISPSEINLNQLVIHLDDTQMTGGFKVNSFKNSPAFSFQLMVDNLDLDRYLPPKQDNAADVKKDSNTSDLPIEQLQALNLNGELKISRFKAANLKMEDVILKMTAEQGQIKISPLNAKMYQGISEGDVKLDVSNTIPRLSVNETLSHIDIATLLTDLKGTADITGKTTITAQFVSDIPNVAIIKKTLAGTAQIELSNGALRGLNLGQAIRDAKALIRKQPLPANREPLQTDFTSLYTQLEANNGLLTSEGLDLKSPLLWVKGRGKINLSTEAIDYALMTAVVDTSKGQGGKELEDLKGLTIPIRVMGTLTNPSISPDLDAYKEILASQLAAKLKEEKQKLLEKNEAELKNELKKQLNNFQLDQLIK